MSDVHSSEASEACSYVALYLVYYFCVTVSDIEITAKQNIYIYIYTVLLQNNVLFGVLCFFLE